MQYIIAYYQRNLKDNQPNSHKFKTNTNTKISIFQAENINLFLQYYRTYSTFAEATDAASAAHPNSSSLFIVSPPNRLVS